MIDSKIESLIQMSSKLYQVESTWMKAIITTETNWNSYAVRYEVNYSYLFNPEKFTKSGLISMSTEIATQKMSWGLAQIMGALAREQGHEGFLSELIKPEVNLKHLAIRLSFLKKHYSDQPSDIFSMYNGGPGSIHKVNGSYVNQSYVNKVKSNLLDLQNKS